MARSEFSRAFERGAHAYRCGEERVYPIGEPQHLSTSWFNGYDREKPIVDRERTQERLNRERDAEAFKEQQAERRERFVDYLMDKNPNWEDDL